MKILNYDGNVIDVDTHVSYKLQGYGNWKLIVTCTYKGNTKLFSCHTTDSVLIDEINDLKQDNATYQEIQDHYINYIGSALDEQILDWIDTIEEDRSQ